MRPTILRRGWISNLFGPMDPHHHQGQISFKDYLLMKKREPFFKARTSNTANKTNLLTGGIVFGSAVVFLGPWYVNELAESTGQHVRLAPPSVVPAMSVLWWEQMWRRGVTKQEILETKDFKQIFDYVESVTGVRADRPVLPKRASDPHATALVPMCGDSTIMKHLVEEGYDVDGVDCSETALKCAVARNEVGLDRALYERLHLHWSDIFSPNLWKDQLKNRQYSFIFERQGFTSIDRLSREDYAFLLKRALKPDGILFCEAVFRTGRVSGNKDAGPPFALSRTELQRLFPESEGYLVKCSPTVDNAVAKLDRESRILKRVPKELYVTTYPCVIGRREVFLASAGGTKPDPPKAL